VSLSAPNPLRSLTWTNVPHGKVRGMIAAPDPRAVALSALIEDLFDRRPALIWGAGASEPLVPTRLDGDPIAEFATRRLAHVSDDRALAPNRLPLLAGILGTPLAPGLTAAQSEWLLEQRAGVLGLDPETYHALVHLTDGGLGTLVSLWLTPEPHHLAPGPRRAGYDLLRFVPRGATLITTNQDGLAPALAGHLDVWALNGQVSRVFLDPQGRPRATARYASSHHRVLPDPFVMLGSRQPPEVTSSDRFWQAWRLTRNSSAVIIVGYRFAAGLDDGSWEGFCRHTGRCKVPVHVVDPQADRVARDVAYGLSHVSPLPHQLAWHRLAFAVLHLMARGGHRHPRELLPRVRQILRLHDELGFVEEPEGWAAALQAGARRMRPKSLAP
jgi:hypothetical protein